jgi:formylglycine-generating enzyme required for sulfatase activity
MRLIAVLLLLTTGAIAADEPAPTPPGAIFTDCTNCPEMVMIPGGTTEMGAAGEDLAIISPEAAAYEQPRHKITVRTFALGRTAVTRAQFSAFVFETGYKVAGGCGGFDLKTNAFGQHPLMNWLDPGFVQSDRDPVVCVSYDDAVAYVKWLTRKTRRPYRLPSEAEWEYAARAGTSTLRYWGDAESCLYTNAADRAAVAAGLVDSAGAAFACNDGHATPAVTGSFKPNGFGLYDMLGNTAQWLADCEHGTYEGAPTDGRPWTGETNCRRMLRGGAWMTAPSSIRVARRSSDPHDAHGNGLGFRVARDTEPPEAGDAR